MTTTPEDTTPEPTLPPEVQEAAMQGEATALINYLQQRCATLHANLLMAQRQLNDAHASLSELTRDNASAGD